MSQQANPMSFKATSAVEQYRLVVIDSSGQVAHCGLAGIPIGVTTQAVAAGSWVGVDHRYRPGTFMVCAGEAMAAGAAVYAGANGKVVDTSTSAGNIIGYACQAASGDGSIIEVVFAGPGPG